MTVNLHQKGGFTFHKASAKDRNSQIGRSVRKANKQEFRNRGLLYVRMQLPSKTRTVIVWQLDTNVAE